MKSETQRWWKQSIEDSEAAKILFSKSKYLHASFFCQQAAEKSLKCLFLENQNEIIKTHDLVLLAKKVGAPAPITELCKQLTPVYIQARYPAFGKECKAFTKIETQEDIKRMEEILSWVKKNLS